MAVEAKPGRDFPVIGVGASAGGLEAFTQLLGHVPADIGMAFVLVQHLDPDHESALTTLLARVTPMPVHEVTNNMRISPDHVYVIPPNTLLSIANGLLMLRSRSEEPAYHHNTIDAFFQSLARELHQRAIGVILSGTASDGTLGLEAIKGEGGITFAQDDSAKYDSMPRSAIAAGCVDLVLSPEGIANELVRMAGHPYLAAEPEKLLLALKHAREDEKDDHSHSPGDSFKKILTLLRDHSGVDFSLYKPNTLHRRIARRMALCRQTTVDEYAALLRGNSLELDALYADALINVTTFFRNPEAFETLKRKVIPDLLRRRKEEPVRVWVPGCSTGQEAYSIAMAFIECSDHIAGEQKKIQIFAADLHDTLLQKARAGLYPNGLVHDVSPERRRRFFVEENGGYRIKKNLREMIVFARQNIVTDPPFSRLDLISCRNLLIYFDSGLEEKAIRTFHYALNPGGCLFLGASESIGSFTELFAPVNGRQKIYSKKTGPSPVSFLSYSDSASAKKTPRSKPSPVTARGGQSFDLNAQHEADRIAVTRYSPPGVLVNAGLQIIQFRGDTGPYLDLPAGKASFDLLKMAREGLVLPLRSAINKAKKDQSTIRRDHVPVDHDGSRRSVNIEVMPLRNMNQPYYLILFEQAEQRKADVDSPNPPGGAHKKGTPAPKRRPAGNENASARIVELEMQVAEARGYLQTIQEEHETAIEELQSSNEEVQSANEELQSINEEVETAKEELESANEELITLNEEMAHRNAELNILNGDLSNLTSSINTAILLLGADLTIRRFTPSTQKLFNLIPTDVGRPIRDIGRNFEFPLLEQTIIEVLDTAAVREREVQDAGGSWYSMRVRPYLTLDNRIDGAVLMFMDIDDLKKSEQAIISAGDYARTIIDSVPPMLILDMNLQVRTANKSFCEYFRLAPSETTGRLIYELGNGQWNVPDLRRMLEEILPGRTHFENYKIALDVETLGRRIMLLSARQVKGGQNILLLIDDITERVLADKAKTLMASIVESSDDAIFSIDAGRTISCWNKSSERLFGYQADDVLGKPLSYLHLPGHTQEILAPLERVLDGSDVEMIETETKGEDGEKIHLLVKFSPIEDASGQRHGVSVFARNITKRRLAQDAVRESAERFRFMAESMQQKIYTADATGTMDYFNKQWTDYTGATLEQLLHSGFQNYIHPDDAAEILRLWNRSVATGESFEVEQRIRGRDNVYRWHLNRTQAMRDDAGKILMWLGSITDINELKQAQEVLQSAKERLVGEAGALERIVSERTSKLRDTTSHLETFVYSIAHDLRAPLRAVQGYAQMLNEDYGAVLDETGIGYTGKIAAAAQSLDRLLMDLLEYSRISEANINLAPISLKSALESAIAQCEELIRANNAIIDIASPLPDMRAHAPILQQVLVNLLSNAVKFVAPGVQPRVRISAEERQEAVRLWIEDNGIGIDPKHQQRIFEVFERAHDGGYSGTGIGLAIVRKGVERMGGCVGMESIPGSGTRFWVELPK